MKFLDLNGLTHFFGKVKTWAGNNYLSLKGGSIEGSILIDNEDSVALRVVDGLSDTDTEVAISPTRITMSYIDEDSEGGEDVVNTLDIQEGFITAKSFTRIGGTATQVLIANGSVKGIGSANGVAGLDSNGYVPLAQLGNLDTIVAEVVTALPTTNIKKHIYLVKDASGVTQNQYEEYLYTGDTSAAYDASKWEKLGDFRATVDLADYAKTANVNAALAKKVDAVSGKGLSTNDFTAAYKSKLDGIAANANNYSLPLAASGTRGGIQLGYVANGRNYPVQLSGEKAYVNVPWIDTTYDLTPYAKKNEVVGVNEIELEKIPQMGKTRQMITFSNINRSDSTSVTFEIATTSMDGFISASDKNKLDGISSGATADSAITTGEIDALFA